MATCVFRKITYSAGFNRKYGAILVSFFSSGNSEQYVIRSPFPDVEIPKMRLHEYVWKDVSKWPNNIALECALSGLRYTYSEARERSRSIAVVLQHICKLNKEDCFAIVSNNHPDYPLFILAASEAGVTATTINPAYSPDEMEKQLRDSEAKLVLTISSSIDTVRQAVNKLGRSLDLLVINDAEQSLRPPGIPHLEEALQETSGKQVSVEGWSIEDNVVLPYSSGTTGLPKGVQLCHRTLVANIAQNASPSVAIIRQTTETFQERILVQLPMFHAMALILVSMNALPIGGKLVVLPKFDALMFIESIRKHKITQISLVPPLALLLANHPAATQEGLASLRLILCGAAPLGENDAAQLKKKIPQTIFLQGYGLTEVSPLTHVGTPEKAHKLASCGMLLPNTCAKIVDWETAKSQPAGKVGEIYIRGPQVMKGYLNKPEANKEALLEGGWLRTGDIGYYDDEGSFYIVDRLKELIKVKGLQVAPAELEEVLRSHPKIHEAAVVGVPDKRAGELPKAFVALKPAETMTEQEVADFVATKVAEYKQLKGGVAFLDKIPKTPSGKMLRRQLKRFGPNTIS